MGVGSRGGVVKRGMCGVVGVIYLVAGQDLVALQALFEVVGVLVLLQTRQERWNWIMMAWKEREHTINFDNLHNTLFNQILINLF